MSTLLPTDLFLVDRSGVNYNITSADVKAFMGGAAAGSDIQSAAAAPTFRSDGTSALVEGDLWFDTTNDLLKGWDGTAWITIGPSASAAGADVQAAAAAPTFRADGTSALVEGDLYYNTTDDTVYAWDGSAWVSTKANAVLKDSNLTTGAALIPGGNDAARPGTPATGMLRYNDQTSPAVVEYYDGSAWVTLSTGGNIYDPEGWFGHSSSPS